MTFAFRALPPVICQLSSFSVICGLWSVVPLHLFSVVCGLWSVVLLHLFSVVCGLWSVVLLHRFSNSYGLYSIKSATLTVTDFTFPFSIWNGKIALLNSGSLKVA